MVPPHRPLLRRESRGPGRDSPCCTPDVLHCKQNLTSVSAGVDLLPLHVGSSIPSRCNRASRFFKFPRMRQGGDGESFRSVGRHHDPVASGPGGLPLNVHDLDLDLGVSRALGKSALRLAMAMAESGESPATKSRRDSPRSRVPTYFLLRGARRPGFPSGPGRRLAAVRSTARFAAPVAAPALELSFRSRNSAFLRSTSARRLAIRVWVSAMAEAISSCRACSTPRHARLLGALLLLLLPSQRPHQHRAAGRVDIDEGQALAAQDQLPHLVRVPGAAGLDDGQGAIALPGGRHVGQAHPGVGDGRDADGGVLFASDRSRRAGRSAAR